MGSVGRIRPMLGSPSTSWNRSCDRRGAAELQSTVSAAGREAPGASVPTAAELHVLPLLTTPPHVQGDRRGCICRPTRSNRMRCRSTGSSASRPEAPQLNGPVTSDCSDRTCTIVIHPVRATSIRSGRSKYPERHALVRRSPCGRNHARTTSSSGGHPLRMMRGGSCLGWIMALTIEGALRCRSGRRRRPLMRAAMVGGAAYTTGKHVPRGHQHEAEQDQALDDAQPQQED
jgi:hypothetical protein